LENGEVCEEFDMDDYYVRPASQRPPPSFRIAVDPGRSLSFFRNIRELKYRVYLIQMGEFLYNV